METRKCKCCGRELPESQFAITKIGMLRTCKECVTNNKKKSIQLKKEQKSVDDKIEEARRLRLSDFTPRELLAELKRLGYKWEKMTIEQVVDYNKI